MFKSKGREGEDYDDRQPESIYSPRIRLEYKPPLNLPAPFPPVLRIEGIWVRRFNFRELTLFCRSSPIHWIRNVYPSHNECSIF